jgi:hypothetical protein
VLFQGLLHAGYGNIIRLPGVMACYRVQNRPHMELREDRQNMPLRFLKWD